MVKVAYVEVEDDDAARTDNQPTRIGQAAVHRIACDVRTCQGDTWPMVFSFMRWEKSREQGADSRCTAVRTVTVIVYARKSQICQQRALQQGIERVLYTDQVRQRLPRLADQTKPCLIQTHNNPTDTTPESTLYTHTSERLWKPSDSKARDPKAMEPHSCKTT